VASKITKEDLKTPDFFVSHGHQVAEFILRFQNFFIGIGALALLAGISWVGFSYWQSHRENVTTTTLYPIEKKMQTEFEKDKKISDGTLGEYQKMLVDNSSARSSLVSLITVTPNLIKAGKAGQALDWFQKLSFQPSSNEVHYSLERMTEGLLALESGQADKAIGFYQQILAQNSQKSFHADALLKLGVAYQMKNDLPKARETFEKVRREHPRSQAGEMAFEYLLFLAQKGA
jgi:hypothetical protein